MALVRVVIAFALGMLGAASPAFAAGEVVAGPAGPLDPSISLGAEPPATGGGGCDAGALRNLDPKLARTFDAKFAETAAAVVERFNAFAAATGGSGAGPKGVWWNDPDDPESGWGFALVQQGDRIAGTWMALGRDGSFQCWVVAAQPTAPDVFAGDVGRVSRVWLEAAGKYHTTVTKAGTARFTFSGTNTATFEYSAQPSGQGPPAVQTRTIARASPGSGAAASCREWAALLSIITPGCALSQALEDAYQRDADIFRARHLIEWGQHIEAFHGKTGRYPLQDRIRGDEVLLVQIATREQQAYLDPRNPKFDPKLENRTAAYTRVPVREFVVEIERELGREIDERYDPQRFPYGPAPIWLSYVVHRNGYLIWAFCRTCPRQPNSFSIPASGGTSTLNIGSRWFIENAPGIHSIASLQANPAFVELMGKGAGRPQLFEQLERAQAHDSKH